jgi:hypothetical protein
MEKETVIIRQFFETKLEGDYPNIDIKVNIEDKNPTFITLPFMKIGSVSMNDGMVYNEETVQAFVEKINKEMPEGNFGHENSLWATMPQSPIVWGGALLDDDGLAWAKGYVWQEDSAKYVKTLKQFNKSVESSFVLEIGWDNIEYISDHEYKIRNPRDANLLNLDLTPAGMAAVQFEERGEWHITKQQVDKKLKNDKEQVKMSEEKIEITDEIKAQVIAEYEKESKNVLLIAQLKDRNEELQNEVETLTQVHQETSRKYLDVLVQSKIAKVLEVEDAGLFEYVQMKVFSQMSELKNEEDIDSALEEIVEGETFKNLAQAVVLQTSGGKAPANGSKSKKKEFDYEALLEQCKKEGIKVRE